MDLKAIPRGIHPRIIRTGRSCSERRWIAGWNIGLGFDKTKKITLSSVIFLQVKPELEVSAANEIVITRTGEIQFSYIVSPRI